MPEFQASKIERPEIANILAEDAIRNEQGASKRPRLLFATRLAGTQQNPVRDLVCDHAVLPFGSRQRAREPLSASVADIDPAQISEHKRVPAVIARGVVNLSRQELDRSPLHGERDAPQRAD